MSKALAFSAALGLLVAGCADQEVKMATAVDSPGLQFRGGNVAPVIPVRTPEGRLMMLGKAGQPIYIVGFFQPGNEACCRIDSRLAWMARQLWLADVTVVAATEPTADCPLSQGAGDSCPPTKRNVLRLLDPDRVAWQAFDAPQPGTVFLIDRFGYIVRTGTVEDPWPIVHKARELADEYDRYVRDLHQGGGGDFGFGDWD